MAAVSNSEKSFREVFDRLIPVVERIAWRITGDRVAAQDIAAETLTRLYARLWRQRAFQYAEPWCVRVATNLAIDELRRRRRESHDGSGSGPDDDAIVQRLYVRDAVMGLPSRQRQVVALRYLADLSERETAESLGLSAGAVKTHLHRGLKALRVQLDAAHTADLEALHDARD